MRERIEFTPDYGVKATQSIIKVIGVGGGGGNAVKHMYKEGIVGIDFLICNTDRSALEASPIPSKLVLGESGLGAGANPEVARRLALESRDKLIDFIGTETKMLFITAGLGKGTGTGAAPIVAEIAKELGILTIAVVTLPFNFEGEVSAQFALAGQKELKKHVDSLITIKNQNIFKYYNDKEADKAFGYVDDVLKNAVKCIAEMITVNSEQNVDFNDVHAMLKESGSAMLGIAEASGEDRIKEVLDSILKCPLLSEEYISNARNFLFSISYGSEKKLLMSELEKLTDNFTERKNKNCHVIWGRNEDPTLGDKIRLSVIISKYGADSGEVNSIGAHSGMFEGDRQRFADVVTKGSTPFEPSAPQNMRSEVDNFSFTSKKENDDFGFLNQYEAPETKQEEFKMAVTEMEKSDFGAGPLKIRTIYDPQYEDDDQFKFLTDTPRIQQLRQDNIVDFQDKAILDSQVSSVEIHDELHDFFKNLPD
jgi:cell division protein FtsZ